MSKYLIKEDVDNILKEYASKAWNDDWKPTHETVRGDTFIEACLVIDDMLTADVQPIDKWIDAQKNPPPIVDRRSMTSESVLILRDNGRCAVAYYCNSAEDGDYWTTDDKTIYAWEEVTHWQPLPELPKGGEVKTTELKPCPFCGDKAVNCTKQYDGRIYRYRIQCDNAGCACRTPWLCYQEDAIEAWNKRTQFDDGGYHDGTR